MNCVVLAAGYATRLYPLTENFPKPLLTVGEKSILDWLLDDLAASGEIEQFVVVSNHKFAGHFSEWAAKKAYPVTVVDDGTESNETRLGAVRDVQFAVEQCGLTGDLLVIAGDNVLDFSLQKFLAYTKEKNTSCVMRYYEPDEEKLKKCGVLTLDERDLIVEMTEKSPTPATHWCCPPFYYYTAADVNRVADGIAAGCGVDAPGSYIAWLCHQTAVHAMEMPGRRYDIGNLQSYEAVQREYRGILNA